METLSKHNDREKRRPEGGMREGRDGQWLSTQVWAGNAVRQCSAYSHQTDAAPVDSRVI